jgi:cytochrome c5
MTAVSGFLRHGSFAPETGHRSAWLARQKSANTGREQMQQHAVLEGKVT